MTQTSNPFAWGGLRNTAASLLADINAAAQTGGRFLINDYLTREFDGALGANPLGPNVPPSVQNANAAQEREAAGYLGTGLSQTEVLTLGAAAFGIVALALIVRK